MTAEERGVATIIEQEGEQVRVQHKEEQMTLPMVGFPRGFRLRPGEHVALVDEPSGRAVRPLVQTTVAKVQFQTLRDRGELEIMGHRLTMQDNTVVYEPDPQERGAPPDEYVLWIVDRGESEGPSQVIAVRRPR